MTSYEQLAIRSLVALAIALLSPVSARAAESFEAKVVEIMDGDTVGALRTDTRAHVKIRLAEIDAPEKSQPFGNQSKKALSALVFGKVVRVDVQTTDRYGRLVGRIYSGDTDVNAAQVQRGMAWAYTRYSKDAKFPLLEAEARAARRGLWTDAHPMAPWDYRSGGKARRTGAATASPPSGGTFACGGKRYCRQMNTCAEAQFYLTQCGVGALDGDRDGVPCEALCN